MKAKAKALVLSAGGIKGFAILGALDASQTILDDIHIFSGTSVGAVICFLLACQWKANDILNWIQDLSIGSFATMDFAKLCNCQGLCSTEPLADFLGHMLQKRGISPFIDFQELYEKTANDLNICATNLHEQQAFYFNRFSTPHLQIMIALRASVTVPFLFEPMIIDETIFVDGALMAPIPIQPLLNKPFSCLPHEILCIGFQNSGISRNNKGAKMTLEWYVVQLYNCFANINISDSMLTLTSIPYMRINVQDVNALDLHIDGASLKILIECGRKAAISFVTSGE